MNWYVPIFMDFDGRGHLKFTNILETFLNHNKENCHVCSWMMFMNINEKFMNINEQFMNINEWFM